MKERKIFGGGHGRGKKELIDEEEKERVKEIEMRL